MNESKFSDTNTLPCQDLFCCKIACGLDYWWILHSLKKQPRKETENSPKVSFYLFDCLSRPMYACSLCIFIYKLENHLLDLMFDCQHLITVQS